ncbi:MAG: SUMF1/EgtB/PvdO family nonheme iron enzyme, partial [Myxococcota bacterium]|nr:SUMF1/EgtB/PvdO family nonheme iron enzyme [Myxococcota bacterium]
PEQRTIPLAQLTATDACAAGLENASRFADLSQAVLVYDVLVAQIQNTVCTKADASGGVTLLGEAEAAAYSECVQESDAQVPLGFKGVPLTQVLTLAAPARAPVQAPVIPRQPTAAGSEWTGSSGYAMVGIAAGSFTMGSPASEKGREDNETQHRVTLTKGFLMGKTEVTQGLWRSVMGSNPSIKDYEGVSLVGDRLPVQDVTWCDAVAFANTLSARDGLSKAYDGVDQCETSKSASVVWNRSSDGYRLPTEAEWEYAARSGKSGPYAGGVSEDGACRVANVSNPRAKSKFGWSRDVFSCSDNYDAAAPVGSFAANAWGLHDMTGNVGEWCWDSSEDDFRVTRGGSWYDEPRFVRVAHLFIGIPVIGTFGLGLRLARTIP